jgi:hypothetical protein
MSAESVRYARSGPADADRDDQDIRDVIDQLELGDHRLTERLDGSRV